MSRKSGRPYLCGRDEGEQRRSRPRKVRQVSAIPAEDQRHVALGLGKRSVGEQEGKAAVVEVDGRSGTARRLQTGLWRTLEALSRAMILVAFLGHAGTNVAGTVERQILLD